MTAIWSFQFLFSRFCTKYEYVRVIASYTPSILFDVRVYFVRVFENAAEYEDSSYKSLHLVQIRENTDQKNSELGDFDTTNLLVPCKGGKM